MDKRQSLDVFNDMYKQEQERKAKEFIKKINFDEFIKNSELNKRLIMDLEKGCKFGEGFEVDKVLSGYRSQWDYIYKLLFAIFSMSNEKPQFGVLHYKFENIEQMKTLYYLYDYFSESPYVDYWKLPRLPDIKNIAKPQLTNDTLKLLKAMIKRERENSYDMEDGYVNPNLIFNELQSILFNCKDELRGYLFDEEIVCLEVIYNKAQLAISNSIKITTDNNDSENSCQSENYSKDVSKSEEGKVGKRISEIIGTDYKKWSRGDLIFIKSGTGTGKTYFVKNVLNAYAKENKKSILYVTNRNNLKKQVINDIGMESNIEVLNYQKLEEYILNNVELKDYDYVVMDEGHYFFVDASFSLKTDLFFKRMLTDKSICKIIMTATPKLLDFYFKRNNIEVNYSYELMTNYDYITNIIAFSKEEYIDSIIESIPEDEQIIYFGNAKKALELSIKYNGAFICSQHNKDYWKSVNQDELSNIIEKSEFKSHILCTTTALDNGVNIKEGTPVKHIIIDILDRDTFVQCLGRKRVSEGEEINLYFNSYSNNKKINGLKKKISDALEQADFLIENGEKEYIKRNYKQSNNYNRIVDEVWDDNENKSVKVVNECIYTKYTELLLMYKSILGKDKNLFKSSYKNIIAIALGKKEDEISDMDAKVQVQTLEGKLENLLDKKLFKEEQKELIEFIGLKANGKLLKSRDTLNAYFKEKNIPYKIDSPNRKSYRDENGNVKKEKSYWEVVRVEDKE